MRIENKNRRKPKKKETQINFTTDAKIYRLLNGQAIHCPLDKLSVIMKK